MIFSMIRFFILIAAGIIFGALMIMAMIEKGIHTDAYGGQLWWKAPIILLISIGLPIYMFVRRSNPDA